jgi:Protein of unknown function (DUF1353)
MKPELRDQPEILLRQVGPNVFQLMEPFAYRLPGTGTDTYEVPAHDLTKSPEDGNSTDLASVPYIFWWFVASHGKQTRAALLHDHLVDLPSAQIKRRDADTAFRLALEESKVPWLRRWLMWTAVSLATNWKSGWGKAYVALFVTFTLAFAFALLWWLSGGRWGSDVLDWWPFVEHDSLYLGGHGWSPALVVAVAGLSLGVRRWLLAMLAVVVFGPPTVLVLVAIVLLWLVFEFPPQVPRLLRWLMRVPRGVWRFFRGSGWSVPSPGISLPRPYRDKARPF